MKITLEVAYEPGDEVYHVTSGDSKGVVCGIEARKSGNGYRIEYIVVWDDRLENCHAAEELTETKPVT